MFNDYIQKYIDSFKETLFAMFNLDSATLSGPINKIKTLNEPYVPLNNLTVQIPFYGTITGDFFLSVESQKWAKICTRALQTDNTEMHNSCLKEFLNITTGQTITVISKDYLNPTYLSPRIIKGTIEYPAIERIQTTLISPELGEVELAIAIDRMKLDINNELDEVIKLMQDKDKQLIHSERLSTLGTMAASIMHEVNNPATFISGNVQILRDLYLPVLDDFISTHGKHGNAKLDLVKNELPKLCDSMMKGVTRIRQLAEKLKSFSRSNLVEKGLVNLNRCTENSIHFTSGAIDNSIIIDFTPDPNPKPIWGDEQQLEQVIINLILNSSQALEKHPAPKIWITVSNKDKIVIFKIKDNGPGIPIENRGMIWNPFFTTKDKNRGNGLGLTISREIIEEHGGNITYTGSIPCSEFTIELPVKEH